MPKSQEEILAVRYGEREKGIQEKRKEELEEGFSSFSGPIKG